MPDRPESRIKGLVEEWLKTADDDIPDVLQQVIQDANNWPVGEIGRVDRERGVKRFHRRRHLPIL